MIALCLPLKIKNQFALSRILLFYETSQLSAKSHSGCQHYCSSSSSRLRSSVWSWETRGEVKREGARVEEDVEKEVTLEDSG